jgi:hypothetical protein
MAQSNESNLEDYLALEPTEFCDNRGLGNNFEHYIKEYISRTIKVPRSMTQSEKLDLYKQQLITPEVQVVDDNLEDHERAYISKIVDDNFDANLQTYLIKTLEAERSIAQSEELNLDITLITPEFRKFENNFEHYIKEYISKTGKAPGIITHVNDTNFYSKMTATQMAIDRNDLPTLKLLVRHGANIN